MLRVCSVLAVITIVGSVPLNRDVAFIGQSTGDLAVALLKNAKYQNQVFSPLGYNTLLAIFAEGAKGETKKELTDVLHLPYTDEAIRLGYKTVLTRLSEKYKVNSPEMKNWFYIYKNFTVDEELQNILREHYLADVKSVERPYEINNEEKEASKVKVPAGLQGKPTDHLIDVDKEVSSIIESSNSPHKSDGEEAASSQVPAMFDEKSKEKIKEDMKDILPAVEKKGEAESEGPKNVVKSEVVDLPGSINNKEKVQVEDKDLPKKEEVSPEVVKEEALKEKEPEMPVKILEENQEKENEKELEETMVAMQRSTDQENELNGKLKGSGKIKGQGGVSRVLAFNGLFFSGNYTANFNKLEADESRPFYTKDGKVFVPTLHSEEIFRVADVPEINSRAIEIKYGGDRYSVLIVVPKESDGLSRMDFKNFPLRRLKSELTEKLVDVCLPVFSVMSISKAAAYSNKLGLTKVFDPEQADLSGFSKEGGLYLDELVQVVTFDFDTNSTETVLLTASLAASRSDVEKFEVNRPFLFFFYDNVDDIVIVNGVIVDPSIKSDLEVKHNMRNNNRPVEFQGMPSLRQTTHQISKKK